MTGDTWPRGYVTGNRAWCSACGRMFGGLESFDLHRGIKQKPRAEDAQDAGRCRVKGSGLLLKDRVYWSPGEWAVRERLRSAREAR